MIQKIKLVYQNEQVVGSKTIINFVSSTGKLQWYRVSCNICGHIDILNTNTLRKKSNKICRKCHTSKHDLHNYARNWTHDI